MPGGALYGVVKRGNVGVSLSGAYPCQGARWDHYPA